MTNTDQVQKQLTSSSMVHTPRLFRALLNDYRIKGEPRRRAIKILSDVYGLLFCFSRKWRNATAELR
jgi:hypothetical protein